MKSKFNWVLTLLMALFVQVAVAQEKTVTGSVVDEFGDPVPGASVLILGTDFGTEADMEGNYSLKAKPGDKLVVKFSGYKEAVLTVGKSNMLNFKLSVDEGGEMLDDIVITTYVKISKPKSNDAVSTVTAKDMENKPNASFVQTLQAKVPGLDIATGSGQPGSVNTRILLRGVGSVNGNTEPLFIVDGVPMESSNFRSINPNDIENISILKDAGATAIYGNRGANGVIEVTTKRGGFEQDLMLKYTGSTGVSWMQDNYYDYMNAEEAIYFETLVNGKSAWNKRKRDLVKDVDTDWLGYFFRPAITKSHTLSFAGGSKNLSSYTSIGYYDQEGILQNTDLERFNLRNNFSGRSNDGRLTYGTNLTLNFSRSNQATSLGTGSVNNNFLIGALRAMPYISPDSQKGSFENFQNIVDMARNPIFGGSLLKMTPVLLVDKLNYFKSYQDELKIIGQGNINYKLSNDWSVGTSLGADYTYIMQTHYEDPRSFNAIYFKEDGDPYAGYQSVIGQYALSLNSTSHLKWEKVFNRKHDVKAGLYMEYISGYFRSMSQVQNGLDYYFSDYGDGRGWIRDNDKNDWYVPSIAASIRRSALFSYFGRLDYDYDTKYGLGLNIRRDASFRFSNENKWGTFWSVSGRWNIGNEKFMDGSIFTSLKLRGSYGTSGNQDILGTGLFGANNLFEEQYTSTRGYNDSESLILSNIANPSLKWETIEQANLGVDFEIFNSRLRGNLDVYQKTTHDLYQTRAISAIHGITAINDNIGSMRNRGVEMLLEGDVVRNDDFRLTLTANGSYNQNRMIKVDNESGVEWGGGLTTLREGDPYGQFYLYRYAGVNPANGNLWFFDKDGNKTETPTDADRVYTGKSFIPVYQGGFGVSADYKGFFAAANFSFVKDVWRFDYDMANALDITNVGVFNKSREMFKSWGMPGVDKNNAEYPSLKASNESFQNNSDRHLKDASYLRLRYAQLGYNFGQVDLNHLKLSGLRVYLQGENLYTWTNWKGFDAESSRGADQGQYPTPRTVSFGVEIQF